MSDATTGEEEDSDDSRMHVPELRHIADTSVSDDQYSTAIRSIWDRLKRDRDAEARGELHVVAGRYVSGRHVLAMDAIRKFWKSKKRAPSLIGDCRRHQRHRPDTGLATSECFLRHALAARAGTRQREAPQLRVVENPLPLSAMPASRRRRRFR